MALRKRTCATLLYDLLALIAYALRWLRLLLRVGHTPVQQHFKLQRSIRGCIVCARLFLPNEHFFTCGVCGDKHDLCSRCHGKHGYRAGTPRSRRSPLRTHVMHPTTLPLLVDPSRLATARSPSEAMLLTFDIYAPRRCLGWRPRQKGTRALAREYSWWTYREVGDKALAFGTGLKQLLMKKKDATRPPLIGVLGAVHPQWFVADYAATLKGLGLVLMHRSTSAAALAEILRMTRLDLLVVSRHLKGIVAAALNKLGEKDDDQKTTVASSDPIFLRHIVWLEDEAEAHAVSAVLTVPQPGAFAAQNQASFADVLALGAAAPPLEQRAVAGPRAAGTVVKLLPSSGSTGLPKLIVLTAGQLADKVLAAAKASRPLAGVTTVYAYESMRQSAEVLLQGGAIGCFSSLTEIQNDCQCLSPTVFAATPTLWNGLLAEYEADVSRALREGEEEEEEEAGGQGASAGEEEDMDEEAKRKRRRDVESRTLLAWKDRQILGNGLHAILSTGAPLAHRVARFLFRLFGRQIVNAYGATEVGGIASNGRVRGEIRLIDCPELGYTTADEPHPRGEILARTPRHACGGYFSLSAFGSDGTFNPDPHAPRNASWVKLAGVLYFRTGDIGERLPDGHVRVIDRCKSFFKLAQGVFVAPEPVEGVLCESHLVHQCWVYGSGLMRRVCAVVVPTAALVAEVEMAAAGTPSESNSGEPRSARDATEAAARLAHHPSLHVAATKRVLRALQKLGATRGLKAWEVPRIIVFAPEPFTQANGLLSAGGKICRPALIRRFRGELEGKAGLPRGREDATSPAAAAPPPPPPSSTVLGDRLCAGLDRMLRDILGDSSADLDLDLAPSTPLLGLGLDSLAVARLSSNLHRRFGAALTPRALFSLTTLGDLEAAVFGGASAVRRAAMRRRIVSWPDEVDAALERVKQRLAEIRGGVLLPKAGDKARSDTVLLTGATGFLGAFLLRALCESNGVSSASCTRVVCIVRAATTAAAVKRLEATLRGYDLWNGRLAESFTAGRVVVLPGDISRPLLGLDDAAYVDLGCRLAAVIHCAAHVSSALPFSALRGANVDGTGRVLALALGACSCSSSAAAKQGVRFIHVSTMGAVPPGHAEAMLRRVGKEKKGVVVGAHLSSGYAQSKFCAEHLVVRAVAELQAAAASSSCTAVVFRPGVISGDSRTGASNTKDAVNMMIMGIIQEGIAAVSARSPLPRTVNLCPVDFVAHAIVTLGLGLADPPTAEDNAQAQTTKKDDDDDEKEEDQPAHFCRPGVFHLCAEVALPLETLLAWVRQAGHGVREVSADVFCARVGKVGEEHPWFPLKSALATPKLARGRRVRVGRGGSAAPVMTAKQVPPSVGQARDELAKLRELSRAASYGEGVGCNDDAMATAATQETVAKSVAYLLRVVAARRRQNF